jgi:two-component system response regulator DesR
MPAHMNGGAWDNQTGSRPADTVNVLLAQDQALMRGALVRLVAGIPGYRICGEAESRSILFQMFFEMPVDCLMLDLCLQGVCMPGYIPDLLRIHPEVKILLMADEGQEGASIHALGRGACGYIRRSAPAAEFIKALQIVRRGKQYRSAGGVAPKAPEGAGRRGSHAWSRDSF